MNYLAHIFLSGNNDNLIIGNFIADFIRGNKYKNFSLEIQNGILLHRKIDSFTDSHQLVRKSKRLLHERYGHYDGVIIDVFFDYFLAKNWQKYTTISLKETEEHFLALLKQNHSILPKKVQEILPYMIAQKWLSSYATFTGIEKVLIGINKRTKEKSKMHLAINDLKEHELILENYFNLFFKELIDFTQYEISKI